MIYIYIYCSRCAYEDQKSLQCLITTIISVILAILYRDPAYTPTVQILVTVLIKLYNYLSRSKLGLNT